MHLGMHTHTVDGERVDIPVVTTPAIPYREVKPYRKKSDRVAFLNALEEAGYEQHHRNRDGTIYFEHPTRLINEFLVVPLTGKPRVRKRNYDAPASYIVFRPNRKR